MDLAQPNAHWLNVWDSLGVIPNSFAPTGSVVLSDIVPLIIAA
jgi:hypothetical protein